MESKKPISYIKLCVILVIVIVVALGLYINLQHQTKQTENITVESTSTPSEKVRGKSGIER
jgi:hypothetical protein